MPLQDNRRGLGAGIAAYAMWGLLPLYFHLIGMIGPAELVAHRIGFSFLFLVILLAWRGRLADMLGALTQRRMLLPLVFSALMIFINWLLYVWAVSTQHVLAASLGYFLNPLVNVVLGRIVLKERLSRMQWLAVLIAASGVAVLAVGALSTIGLSLALAFSFGLYGLVRKMLPVDPMVGLGVETTLLMPLAGAWIVHGAVAGSLMLSDVSPRIVALVAASGIITTVPLLLFAFAAQRMPLSTLGLLQYLAPTIQLMIGVFLLHEPMTHAHMIAFPIIWAALAIYSFATWRGVQARKASAET